MALDFPATPSLNDTYEYTTPNGDLIIYKWDGEKWITESVRNDLLPDPDDDTQQPGTIDDRYVNVTGDNMTGDLTLGTDKIKLNTDGSATFTSKVTSASTQADDPDTTLVTKDYITASSPETAGDLTYTYPGGVEQTVQARLEQRVSIKDFGAVGDGVTDDTTAIQSAFNWWCGAKRRALSFPEGDYLCTSRINALQNMATNLTGNSLICEGGRLHFQFPVTGITASKFGLVLDLVGTNKLMRELVISGLSIAGNYDEYAMLIDGGISTDGSYLYGFAVERLYTSSRGLCVSGNTFEGVIKDCYLAGEEGNGNDPSNTYVPVVPTLLVTEANINDGTGDPGGGSRKLSSMAIDSNNIRGGLNGIRIDDGADDITLRNNTTLTSWQYGLVYNSTFGGCNILHHHAENCWQQYSESSWEDTKGRGFFDQSGNRWSGTSGNGSGAGTVADPIQGNWSEWYSAASKSERNIVLQRAGINVSSSGGGGNILGCRQIADSNGGTMSAVNIYAITASPTFISGNIAKGMGAEVCVSGSGSIVLNSSSYEIVGGWPQVIQQSGASTRPMLQSTFHGTGVNTNNQYTPFSQSYQSSIRGSIFIRLETGVTINAPLASNNSNNGYDAVTGDELHFIFQQTSQSNATVTWDSIYETNGFVAKTGTNALSAISFRYIADSQGNNKWVVISNPGTLPDFGSQNITTTGSIRAEGGISFEDIPDPQPSDRIVNGNTLSEYEEGSFSPDLSIGSTALGLTGNDAIGRYTKIGNLCQVQIRLVVNSEDVTESGILKVTGLPFASPNIPASNYAVGAVGIKNMASSFKTGDKSIYVTNSSNSSDLDLLSGSRSSGQELLDTDFDFSSGSCDFYISLIYRTA